MRSLGLDVGEKRTGVAISDPQGILATPLTVVTGKDENSIIDQVLKLVEQYNAERVVVGLPLRLDGEIGIQANKIRSFVERLSLRAKQRELGNLTIQLWDERLSTKAVERLKLQAQDEGNKFKSKRKTCRAAINAMAAAFILQGFLDSLKDAAQCPD